MNAKIIFYKQTKLDQNTKFKLRRELLGIEQKRKEKIFTKETFCVGTAQLDS